MYNRDFSDTIKLEIIKNNLEKNKGEINCEVCNKKIVSINDCHFDHILPYSKGGKTTISNCQILCVNCNLKKNDKDLKEFLLEEKARKFLSGEIINDLKEDLNIKSLSMSKEIFDKRITEFINKKGDISKVDFGREYNNLP
ncbi:MAG: HNH endonuclease, partial [Bacilli bacterium]|nr:HNH endonuclease [Bacilli bacterium]